MKKVVSMLTAICIVLTLFSGLSISAFAATGETVLVNDDFSVGNEASHIATGNGTAGKTWITAGSVNITTANPFVKDSNTDYGQVFSFNKVGDKEWPQIHINMPTAITSGKALISFDLKVNAFAGNDYIYMRTWSGSGNWGSLGTHKEFLKLEKVNDTLKFRQANDTETTVDKWVHIDVKMDLDTDTVSYYINGEKTNDNTTTIADVTSIGAISINGVVVNSSEFYLDNFVVRHNPAEMSVKKVTPNNNCSYVDVEFNNSVSTENSDLTKVTLEKLGTDTCDVTVNEVKVVKGNILRIKYDGIIDPGREYLVKTNGAVKSIFGETAPAEILFNAEDNTTGKTLTYDLSKYTNDTVLEKDDENLDILYKTWTTDITATKGNDDTIGDYVEIMNSSTKTDSDDGYRNLTLVSKVNYTNEPVFKDPNGVVSYKFNVWVKSWSAFGLVTPNGSRIFNLDAKTSNNTGNNYAYTVINAVDSPSNTYVPQESGSKKFTTNTWHLFEVKFDYTTNKIKVYVDSEYIYSIDMTGLGYTHINLQDGLQFTAWDASGYGYRLANYSITYSEAAPAVSAVRYVNGTAESHNAVQTKVDGIKVKFNQPMDTSTLSDVTVSQGETPVALSSEITAVEGEDNTFKFTPETAIENNGVYKLTIPTTVKTATGVALEKAVTYDFCIGTTEITAVTGPVGNVTAEYGQKLNQIAGLKATGTYDGGTIDMDVDWNTDGYYRKTPGTYTVTGTPKAPFGYSYNGNTTVSATVVVPQDPNVTESLISNPNEMLLIGTTVLAAGGLSTTDSLQLGLKNSTMTITSEETENANAIADATNEVTDSGMSELWTGKYHDENAAIFGGDGEIDIDLSAVDAAKTLKDIQLVFEINDQLSKENAKLDIELMYKNSEGNWIRFYKLNKDLKDELYSGQNWNGLYNNTPRRFPIVVLKDLESVTDAQMLRIKLNNTGYGYKLLEADVNLANDDNLVAGDKTASEKQLRLPKIYSTGAVIQRENNVKIWGFGGDAEDTITVKLNDGTSDIVTKTATYENGKWTADLGAVTDCTKTYSITVTSGTDSSNTVTATDILFGDVYLASGQSNMAYSLGSTYNALGKEETDAATAHQTKIMNMATETGKNIRFLVQDDGSNSVTELEDAYSGVWRKNGDYHGSMHHVSAISFFFAYELNTKTKVPIGVYDASLGGSGINTWLPEDSWSGALSTLPEKPEVTPETKTDLNTGRNVSGCYNAQIAPLTSASIKGILWYQGEGDVQATETYKTRFDEYMRAYSEKFNNNTMTFNVVQLAGYSSNFYPEFRQGQLNTWLKNNDRVNLVSAIDVSKKTNGAVDIHPTDKYATGVRLANGVYEELYNTGTKAEYNGPLFEKVRKTATGLEVIFTTQSNLVVGKRTPFDTTVTADGTNVNNVEISKNGTDWESTVATVDGKKLVINCDADYKWVRYAWKPNVADADLVNNVNLYNGANYPAYPFMACADNQITANEGKIKFELLDRIKYDGTIKAIVATYTDDTFTTLSNVEIVEFDNTKGMVVNESALTNATVGDNTKVMIVDDASKLIPLAPSVNF